MSAIPIPAEQLERLRRACAEEPQALALFLFGSQADGYATPHSDVDLAVLLAEELPLEARLAFESKLCRALGREDVDLLSLARAPISLRFRAISGQLLYERRPDPVSDFIQRTLVDYFDFQPVLETYRREFARSLEIDYGL